MKELIFDKTRRMEKCKTYKTYIFQNKVIDELKYLLNSFDRDVNITNIKSFTGLVHTAAYKFHKVDYAIKIAQHMIYLNTPAAFVSEKLITDFYYAPEVQELKRFFGQIPIDVKLCEVSKDNDELILKEVTASDKDWIILNSYASVESEAGVKLIDELGKKVSQFMAEHCLISEDLEYNIMSYSIKNIRKK